jgi:hypothetical protein
MSLPLALSRLEARPLPPGWEHPQGSDGTGPPVYLPLSSYADLLDWLRGAGSAGEHAAVPPHGHAGYMPPVPDGRPARYACYETAGGGIPLSPAFGTVEELAAWCEEHAGALPGEGRAGGGWVAAFQRDLRRYPPQNRGVACPRREGSLPVACAAERQVAAGKSGAALAALAVAGFDAAPAWEILSAARRSISWQARVAGPHQDDVVVAWHGNGAWTVSWGTVLSLHYGHLQRPQRVPGEIPEPGP